MGRVHPRVERNPDFFLLIRCPNVRRRMPDEATYSAAATRLGFGSTSA